MLSGVMIHDTAFDDSHRRSRFQVIDVELSADVAHYHASAGDAERTGGILGHLVKKPPYSATMRAMKLCLSRAAKGSPRGPLLRVEHHASE